MPLKCCKGRGCWERTCSGPQMQSWPWQPRLPCQRRLSDRVQRPRNHAGTAWGWDREPRNGSGRVMRRLSCIAPTQSQPPCGTAARVGQFPGSTWTRKTHTGPTGATLA